VRDIQTGQDVRFVRHIVRDIHTGQDVRFVRHIVRDIHTGQDVRFVRHIVRDIHTGLDVRFVRRIAYTRAVTRSCNTMLMSQSYEATCTRNHWIINIKGGTNY
jgi:hypothetical protein